MWNKILKHFKLNWVLKDIWYRMDFRKPTPSSVKNFLKENVGMTQQLVYENKLPKFSGTRDEKVLKILKWIIKNFKYESDKKRFGVVEKWQTVQESLTFKKGDCEDMSILLFCLCRVHGINPLQIRLVAGYVDVNGKKTGHCYVEYCPDFFFHPPQVWFIMDWCFHPEVRPFLIRIPKRVEYLNKWFEVTDF